MEIRIAERMKVKTIIATDGSCIGNPGPGAFAIVAQSGQKIIDKAIPVPATTVGEMEVRGLLEALLFVADNDLGPDVLIKCDSQYIVNGYNDWMASWETKGWHKKGGLAHASLWKDIALLKSLIGTNVRVEWVRAHQTNGCPLNARADEVANSCARSQRTSDVSLHASLSLISERLGGPATSSTATTPVTLIPSVTPAMLVDMNALITEALDLLPRVSDDDPIAPALADWCDKARSALAAQNA